MSELKYKVGDKVRIKSLDWYNENKNKYGSICFSCAQFTPKMSICCGDILTICDIEEKFSYYYMEECAYVFTDEMIEGLVEEESEKKLSDESWRYKNIFDHSQYPQSFECPEGYIFKDENGNVINATKIVLEKVNTLKTQSDNMETETHRGYCTTEEETTNKSKKVAWFTFGDNDFADKVELDLSNRELIHEDGKWFVVKKKKEYPKTYEECCKVLEIRSLGNGTDGYKWEILSTFQNLIVCRDAYWKIAGEEMGLDKPWEPDYTNTGEKKFSIWVDFGEIKLGGPFTTTQMVLSFPTEEMRDDFKKNFDPDIEICKEFL